VIYLRLKISIFSETERILRVFRKAITWKKNYKYKRNSLLFSKQVIGFYYQLQISK